MNKLLREWRLTPLQLIFGGVMAVFLIAVVAVIIFSYQNGVRTRLSTTQDTEILATLANVQRHGLLLNVETMRWLRNPQIGMEEIEHQRAFINAQLRVLTPQVQEKAEILAKIGEIRASLEQYDAAMAAAETSNPVAMQAFGEEISALLDVLEREQIKTAYDLAEREFLVVLSENLDAQQFAQQLLIGLGFVLFAMIMGVGVWLARTTRAAYETQQQQVQTLEKAVAERTKTITLTGDVTRRISSILNRRQLAEEVVQQLQSAFGYYHAHIYLLEEGGEILRMAGGTGEAGQMLLAQGHQIPRGKGLVGRAAETGEPVLVPDTSTEADWLPNPLLPETRAEIAMPIISNDVLLGVLDVQNQVAGSLSVNDVETIRTIADQVGIALQNILASELTAKRAAELQTVSVISTATATIRDAEEMLATVVRLTQRRFGLYHVNIFEYQSKPKTLKITACGWAEGSPFDGLLHGDSPDISLEQANSLVARAARSKRAPASLSSILTNASPHWCCVRAAS